MMPNSSEESTQSATGAILPPGILQAVDQWQSEADNFGERYQQLRDDMYALVAELFPICRSISGEGLRETLKIIQRQIPLRLFEVPSGTQVFDWTVPREWNIRDAYVMDDRGTKVIDFNDSNLHVVNYSAPVQGSMNLDELLPHLHSLPDKPDWIPYRTAYYDEQWGFCLTDRKLKSLRPGQYSVVIDSDLSQGSLTYAELYLPGRKSDEILLFAHCCHPSLCNDNLSGLVVLTFLASILAETSLTYSVRFLFAPATIGSITWLAQNEAGLSNIKAGLIASSLGDVGHFRYKQSPCGNSLADQASKHVLEHYAKEYEILDFDPYGYDERQFCSPGINLPVGRLTRSPNGEYPEYHSSADNLELISPRQLADSVLMFLHVLAALECNMTFENTNPKCEPQLGRRGLYRKMGGFQDIEETKLALLWMLGQSDGRRSLLDIAERSGCSYRTLFDAATLLHQQELLRIVD